MDLKYYTVSAYICATGYFYDRITSFRQQPSSDAGFWNWQ